MSVAVSGPVVGMALPVVEIAPITRQTLRDYADASGDDADIHLDTAVAQANGFPDVIAHGLLVMAYLARAVGQWFPDRPMQDIACRFLAITLVGDQLRCGGTVVAVEGEGAQRRAELALEIRNQSGDCMLKGSARVACPA